MTYTCDWNTINKFWNICRSYRLITACNKPRSFIKIDIATFDRIGNIRLRIGMYRYTTHGN